MFHLLSCIVHRLSYHREEESILIIPDFMSDKIELERFNELKENQIFKEVIVFPYRKLGGSEKEIRNNALVNYNQYFGTINRKDLKFYLYGAHFYFSLALIENGIKYDVFEEASGAYTHQQILKDAVEKSNKLMAFICTKYNTFGYDNECIENVWIDYSAQEGTFATEKVIDFCVTKRLKDIEKEEINKLLNFFRVPKIDIADNAVVLLTQHFMNLSIMSYEQQAIIYKTFIDSFFPNRKICIKSHPDDFMDYANKILHCEIIQGKFPIELLPYIGEKEADTVATIYSTAIYTIKDYFKKSLVLDMTYRESYKSVYQYYVVGSLINLLQQLSNKWNYEFIGTDVKHLEAMIEANFKKVLCRKNTSKEEGNIYVIDDFGDREDDNSNFYDRFIKMDFNDVFIFINSQKKYRFGNKKEYLQFMIPIEIEINQRDYNKWKQRKEVIYVFTKNTLWRQVIEEMAINKEFENLEKVVDVKQMSKEEIRIHALEGILHATEQRLLECLEEKENV